MKAPIDSERFIGVNVNVRNIRIIFQKDFISAYREFYVRSVANEPEFHLFSSLNQELNNGFGVKKLKRSDENGKSIFHEKDNLQSTFQQYNFNPQVSMANSPFLTQQYIAQQYYITQAFTSGLIMNTMMLAYNSGRNNPGNYQSPQ